MSQYNARKEFGSQLHFEFYIIAFVSMLELHPNAYAELTARDRKKALSTSFHHLSYPQL